MNVYKPMDQVYKMILEASGKVSKKFPYYGPALSRCRYVLDNKHCPTLGMSQNMVIAYNEKFVKSLNADELQMILVHEILHYLSNHHARAKVQDENNPNIIGGHETHNVAMDIEINQYLTDECDYIKDDGMTPEKFGYPKGKTYEEYLRMLITDLEKRKDELSKSGKLQQMQNSIGQAIQDAMTGSSGSSGSPGSGSTGNDQSNGSGNADPNDCKDPTGCSKEEILDSIIAGDILKNTKVQFSDADESSKATSKVKQVAGACDAAKQRADGIGNSSSFSALVREVPKKKYPWKSVLKNVLRSRVESKCKGCDCKTYTEYNRRLSGVSKDIIFGTKYSEYKSYDLIIGVDVSGSMGDLTTQMYSYIKSIRDHLSDDAELHVTIAECDTEVGNVLEDFDTETKSVKSCSGGGTDMDAIVRWVDDQVSNKKRKSPDLIIIMTDNEVSWGDPNPKWKNKIIVMTDQPGTHCPYKQYDVEMPTGQVAVEASA